MRTDKYEMKTEEGQKNPSNGTKAAPSNEAAQQMKAEKQRDRTAKEQLNRREDRVRMFIVFFHPVACCSPFCCFVRCSCLCRPLSVCCCGFAPLHCSLPAFCALLPVWFFLLGRVFLCVCSRLGSFSLEKISTEEISRKVQLEE